MRLSESRAEAGYTLVELLVAMTVGLVVVAGALSLIGSAGPLSAATRSRVDANQRGRLALDQMLMQLNSQHCLDSARPPLTEAKADDVTFYASLGDENSTPQRRRLTYANGSITERVVQATGAFPNWNFGGPVRTRLLASGMAKDGTAPVFRYYAFTTAQPIEPKRELVPGATGLTADQMADVVRIGVAFTSKPTKDGVRSSKDLPFEGSALVRTAEPLSPSEGPGC